MAITTVDLGSVMGPQGIQGPRGLQGPAGATGPQGSAGAKGADGTVWIIGTAAPTTQGKTGDLFLNKSNFDVYSKASGNWVKTGNIKGATGAAGPQGNKGDTGPTGPQGAEGKTPNIGANGHWFVGDRDTGIMGDASKAVSAKIVNSLTTTEAGYALDARQGKVLDGKIASLNSTLGIVNNALGKCKLIDTGYVKDSAYIEVPEGTVALAVVSDAVYLIRSLSSGIKHTLIAGTLAETYKIRAASSTGRFYAEAVTAGSTCRISAVIFKG